MIVYREYTFWSPLLGARATRLSVPDERGAEYFAILARQVNGRTWRETRDDALRAIELSIMRGDEPGEVGVDVGAS